MLTIEALTHTAKESVEVVGEKHLESMVFHTEPRCHTDAVGCRKLLGEMVIHRAVEFVQFLFADAGEHAECIVSEEFANSIAPPTSLSPISSGGDCSSSHTHRTIRNSRLNRIT